MANHSGLPVYLTVTELTRAAGTSRERIERAFAYKGLTADALVQYGLHKQPLIRADRLAEVIPLVRPKQAATIQHTAA